MMATFAPNPRRSAREFKYGPFDQEGMHSHYGAAGPPTPSQSDRSQRTAMPPSEYYDPDPNTHAQQAVARPPPAKVPDWNEFYKNGLPREIIVIDDSPEPTANGTTTAAGSNSAAAAPPASQYRVIAPSQQVSGRKRKYEEPVNGTARNGAPADDAHQAAAAGPSRKRRAEHPPSTSTRENGTAQDQAPVANITPSVTIDLRSPETTSKYSASVASSSATHPRKRTRTQQNGTAKAQSTSSRLRNASTVEYCGLMAPVRRARDVPVRVERMTSINATKKIDDEDGHYIVIPDATIASQYHITKLLGQGTFGKVVQAYNPKRREHVAVKIVRSVQKYRDAARLELRVLQTLRENDEHNKFRCIHLRDCFDFHGHICIVTDLLQSSLFDFLKANSFVPFPNSHIQSFAKQLLTSVAFIHDLGLIHTDLKPENILLSDASYQTFTYNRTIPSSRTGPGRQAHQRRVLLRSDIRLIDFGSATFEDEYHSSVVSTRHYRAPEIILGLGWSYPCDIWSIGCILVEFFTGDALFQTHENLEHLAMMEAVLDGKIEPDLVRKVNRTSSRSNSAAGYFKRLKLNYPTADTSRASRRFVKSMKPLGEIIPPNNSFLEGFLDLLQKMLIYDPAHRITAKQALQHPWFRESVRDDGTEAARLASENPEMLRRGARKQSSALPP